MKIEIEIPDHLVKPMRELVNNIEEKRTGIQSKYGYSVCRKCVKLLRFISNTID